MTPVVSVEVFVLREGWRWVVGREVLLWRAPDM